MAIAVNGGRRRINHRNCPAARSPRLVKNVDCAGLIDLVGAQRFEVALFDRGNRSEVETAVDTVERAPDNFGVGDIGFDEFDRANEVVAIAAREVVEDPHRVPVVKQRLDEVRTYKPGAAGHQITSHP